MFNLGRYGNAPCLEGGGVAYTYSDVKQLVDSMGSCFSERDLVLCFCENTIESLLGYICFMTHRQVAILIEADQKLEAVHRIIEQYTPEFLWLPTRFVDMMPECDYVYRFGDYVLLKLAVSGENNNALPADLQLLLTTSGSTGSKKFVRITRKNLESNAASIVEYLGMRSDDVAITTLPYSYSFGLSIINTHLLVGGSIQVTNLSPLSREFWELVEVKGVTSLSGVPYTFEMLKRIKFERFELNSIRYISQAGGKMRNEVLAYLKDVAVLKDWLCFVMYGQTEATARMSYLPPYLLDSKAGSIGVPITGGDFEIVSEDGTKILEPMKCGELVYVGPNVGMGYAENRTDLYRGDDWHGCLHTGDIGYRDDDGFYYISGRLKRFVKIFGRRVSLDEVEDFLSKKFKGCEFICFRKDECLKIGYVGLVAESEILAFISEKISIHRGAVDCTQMSEMPRLGNGKINYSELDSLIV